MNDHHSEYLERLVNMANQIVHNLQFGKTEEALIAATVGHIKRSWTPTMYGSIIDNMDSLAEQLDPIAQKAFKELK